MSVSMDALTASLDAHCDVAANPYDTNRPHPRYSDYSNLREPASLMGDQNKRRTEFLERQKGKRESLLNLRRGLTEESKTTDDAADPATGSSTSEESHQFVNIPASAPDSSKWTFKHQLMMSEWLVDVPVDLPEKWLAKPCPKGRRMLVVAHRGMTKAYSKAGHPVAFFKSALPSGGHSSRCITILDCIWNYQNRTYYVLDVLAWNNVVLLDCETEFRFYWLKTKLDEIPEIGCHTDTNRYAFVALPYIECKEQYLTELMSKYPMFSEDNDPGLDGILFYHKSNLYEHGSTPLVTWMKPFMMVDVLGIKIHDSYSKERPAQYQNQATYIREFEESSQARKDSFRNRGWRREKVAKRKECHKMDTSEGTSEDLQMVEDPDPDH